MALAVVTVRFIPIDWPGLKSRWLKPMILCGQHSLEIFCLGIFLSFHRPFCHFGGVAIRGNADIDQRVRDYGHGGSCVADHVVQQLSRGAVPGDDRNRRRRTSREARHETRCRGLIGILAYVGAAAAGAGDALRRRGASGACRRRAAARCRRHCEIESPEHRRARHRRRPRCPARTGRRSPIRRGSRLRCGRSCRTWTSRLYRWPSRARRQPIWLRRSRRFSRTKSRRS